MAGFDVILSGSGTEDDRDPPPRFSIEDMVKRWSVLARDFDPARLNALLDIIEVHKLTEPNPHGVSAEDIANALALALGKILMPGLPPASAPSLAFFAELMDVISSDFTVSRTGSIWVTNAAGVLTEVSANTLAIDYGVTTGALIPIFPARTNTFTRSDVQEALDYVTDDGTSRIVAAGDASVADSAVSIVSPAGDGQAVSVTDVASSGDYGVKLESLGVSSDGTVCDVSSVFILPGTAQYATLQLVDDSSSLDVSDITAVVNLQTGEVVSQGDGVDAVYVHQSPSGWWRIGIQYTIVGSDDISLEIYGHPTDSTTTYTGDASVVLSIFGACNMAGAGLAPYCETTGGATAGYGATTIAYDMTDIVNTTDGMFAIDYLAMNNTTGSQGAAAGTALISMDADILLTPTATGIQTTLDAVNDDFTLVNDSFVLGALVYSADKVTSQFTGSDQDANTGLTVDAFEADATLTFGPAIGYVRSFAYYPIADHTYGTPYLIGEPAA
jgi:hypothetical protein